MIDKIDNFYLWICFNSLRYNHKHLIILTLHKEIVKFGMIKQPWSYKSDMWYMSRYKVWGTPIYHPMILVHQY